MHQRSLLIGITILMIVVALLGLMPGALAPADVGPRSRPPARTLDVEVDHFQRVALDEVAPRLDDVAH